jgi:hypothetical protein
MGFANVLTAKDVTLSVRDMVGLFGGAEGCLEKNMCNWSGAYRSLQHGHMVYHPNMLATAQASFGGVCGSGGELSDGRFEVALCSSEIVEADVSGGFRTSNKRMRSRMEKATACTNEALIHSRTYYLQ